MESRTKNTKRNIISGIIKQTLNILLPFIGRTIVLYLLGAMYQGLGSLFTSILQVLNLAELGFSSAVMFVLYKPIADNDTTKICAITYFLKKVYFVIGMAVLICGLVIMPFLPYLISGDIPSDINIYILFAIYLFNASISYLLFAYRSTLLSAMQREDVVSNVYTVTTTAVRLIQIIGLFLFKNYYVYIIIVPLGTIANNVLLQYFSKKMFPEVKPIGKIDAETKKAMNKQIRALFIGKVADVARNSFDNIIISVLFGLIQVAIYDNYYYVYSSLYGMTLVITHAMQASIGNSIAKETVEKNYKDLIKFNFIFSWLMGWMAICMLCLYQPFMYIWVRGDKALMFSTLNMVLFCVYFYTINMNNMRNLYLQGTGLFWECRIWYILEAVANMVLNILLGYFIGITGILVATVVTIFVFNFLARTHILFKNYFQRSQAEFYFLHLIYAVITCVIGVGTYFLCGLIQLSGIGGLLLKALVCLCEPNLLYMACYFWTKNYKDSLKFARNMFGKKRKSSLMEVKNDVIREQCGMDEEQCNADEEQCNKDINEKEIDGEKDNSLVDLE